MSEPAAHTPAPRIVVNDLTMAYGDFVIMRDLNFVVQKGDIFIIMGGSGCGKSTLLRVLIGLKEPAAGKVLYREGSLWDAEPQTRAAISRRTGILYQSGALFSSMTLAENIAQLHDTHRIERCAVFDQFPWTHHMESGVLLVRR